MTYEITTPLLKNASDKLDRLMGEIEAKNVDAVSGHAIIRAANGIRTMIETDLKIRLASPRLAEIEGGGK